MESKYFDELDIGETFTTNARTITEADQLNYAGLSGNFDPIHLDKGKMEATEFGGRLVYGYLVLNVMEGQKVQTGLIEDSVIAFYGIDKARFTNPVMIGDTVHTELTVLDLDEKDESSGVVVLEEKGVNQDGEDVVVAETRTLIKKRD
nr:MaoC/PaaZ C-terminal domain-containing protein [Halomarina sp. BCD28]